MLLEQLRPKEPKNLKRTLVAVAVMVGAAVLGLRWSGSFSPKRGMGLVFGIVAALLLVLGMLYSSRPLRRLLSARAWMQAHVYLGWVTLVAVILHAGSTWPHGFMGGMLLGLSLWVTVSGMVGVFLQKRLPPSLRDGLTVEALYERIPALVDELRAEADALMTGVGDALESFYLGGVRDRLSRLEPHWGYLLDPRSGRERALEPFRKRRPFFEEEEQPLVDDLMSILTEKLELDAQYRVQTVLRRWHAWTLHVPAAGILMGLVFIHILSWVVY